MVFDGFQRVFVMSSNGFNGSSSFSMRSSVYARSRLIVFNRFQMISDLQ